MTEGDAVAELISKEFELESRIRSLESDLELSYPIFHDAPRSIHRLQKEENALELEIPRLERRIRSARVSQGYPEVLVSKEYKDTQLDRIERLEEELASSKEKLDLVRRKLETWESRQREEIEEELAATRRRHAFISRYQRDLVHVLMWDEPAEGFEPTKIQREYFLEVFEFEFPSDSGAGGHAR